MQYQSSAKRSRTVVDQGPNIYDIVSGIHQAVTTKQRFEILLQLFALLEYDVATRACRCDPRVLSFMNESGVVNALVLQLGFVLHRHGSAKEELDLTCTALDLFHRFCPELITEDSLRNRGVELFRLLSEAFKRGTILPVLSIWHSCSSCNYGTTLLRQDSSMLQAVGEVLRRRLCDEEGLMEALGLLKNVTYYGEEFRQRVIEQPGLVTCLTSLSETEVCDKAQERLSAVIRNLALSSDTRLLLAQRSDVLTAIARMASSTNRHTIRNLLNTMVSLAMDADSCLLMVFHGDGILVEVLKRFVVYENDAIVRKRAARALRLMARETSAPLLVHDNQLMEFLSHRALHDVSSDVRMEAAEAFARCAGLIKAPMAQHDAVLDALTHLASSPYVLPDVMARALKEQASHKENRKPMAKREKLMVALAKIGVSKESSRSAKENVCSTLFDLSDDESNRVVIATPPTLEALVHNTVDRSEGHARIRECAVRTLLNLAVIQSNRKNMANHTSLLQALLHFAAGTQVDDLKKQVKKVILQLAAEL
jgi:hypothetical protein